LPGGTGKNKNVCLSFLLYIILLIANDYLFGRCSRQRWKKWPTRLARYFFKFPLSICH
jgi:hypothetical protein